MTYIHRCCASEGGLLQDGPLVEARLSPPRIQAERLTAEGVKVPSVAAMLMIDTGAAKSAVDNAFAARLSPTEALGIPSPRQGEPYNGFIGRDFLAFWRLTYDGPSGAVEMQIEP